MADETRVERWQVEARHVLLGLRAQSAAWGYRRGAPACVEPTVLAALALQADGERDAHPPETGRAAEWVGTVQRSDGSVGSTPSSTSPGWGTPYALLLWKTVGGYDAARHRAARWLLGQKVDTFPIEANSVVGHDTTLHGWPWVSGTHSWVEPTALAVLALRREGLGNHPRVREGLRVITDRAIETGGWNCGNKKVYGRVLRAQPGPTGLALLALAPLGERSDYVEQAIAYLRSELLDTRTAESLGWGLLGLRAWGEWPEDADRWLRDSFAEVKHRVDAAPRLAMLLLAAGQRTLELFNG